VVLLHRTDQPPPEPIAALAAGKKLVDGKPAAWFCTEQSCREPVTDPAELGRMLDEIG
jgi:uncharacterized protein YyaL (SSP411 family)